MDRAVQDVPRIEPNRYIQEFPPIKLPLQLEFVGNASNKVQLLNRSVHHRDLPDICHLLLCFH